MATKKTVKKSVTAKPSTKSAAKKKPAAAKKPAAVKKPAAAKKPAAVEAKRIPPRITKKVTPIKPEAEFTPIDTAKAVAFGMDIVRQLKKDALKAEKQREEPSIRLTRRPTTRTQGRSTEKFPAKDLKIFRKRLLEARAQALSGVDAMKATGFNESEDHEADGGDGTSQTLRLQALGQMGNIKRTIQQIDEALHRIDDGTYGVCTICGQLIRKPRLLNQPFVLTCMECQNEMERSAK